MMDALYDQLKGKAAKAYAEHLDRVSECQVEFLYMESVVSVFYEPVVEEPEPKLADKLWARLEPELDRVDSPRAGVMLRRFFLVAAALFVAALGLWFGTLRETPLPVVPTPGDPGPLTHYLDKAQPLLLAVANHRGGKGTATGFDHQTERDHAALLAEEAARIRTSIARTGSVDRLLGDIELLLLQVANLEDSQYGKEIALVQDYMQRRTILLKVSLLEMITQTT